MSPLWILPVVVVALGLLAVAVVARQLAEATRTAAAAVDDLRTLGAEAGALQAEAEAVRRRLPTAADVRRRAAIRPRHDR